MATTINPRFPDGLEGISPHDRRNVIDHYKYWEHEAIVADLDSKRTELVVVCENFAYDFNIATVVRNANAFVAKCLWIVGRKKFDRRGTCGTHKYEHIHNAESIDEVLAHYPKHNVVAIDNVESASPINDYRWHQRSIVIFGQEQIGVSNNSLARAADIVYIPQMGSTRSLNVGTASGIAMYDYMTKSNKHFLN
jgi:tRNA G18 (ribose-2'-O)-methylase SpoU